MMILTYITYTDKSEEFHLSMCM